MNFSIIDNKSFTNHPYIISGFVTTLIWIMFSLVINKKYNKLIFINSFMFILMYSLGWVIWNYMDKNNSGNLYTNSNINNNNIRYTICLYVTVLWFLHTLIFQKKSIYKAFMSTAIFFIFYIISEIVFTILNTI